MSTHAWTSADPPAQVSPANACPSCGIQAPVDLGRLTPVLGAPFRNDFTPAPLAVCSNCGRAQALTHEQLLDAQSVGRHQWNLHQSDGFVDTTAGSIRRTPLPGADTPQVSPAAEPDRLLDMLHETGDTVLVDALHQQDVTPETFATHRQHLMIAMQHHKNTGRTDEFAGALRAFTAQPGWAPATVAALARNDVAALPDPLASLLDEPVPPSSQPPPTGMAPGHGATASHPTGGWLPPPVAQAASRPDSNTTYFGWLFAVPAATSAIDWLFVDGSGGVGVLLAVIANTVLCAKDVNANPMLEEEGQKGVLVTLGLFFIPAYVWRRTTLLKTGRGPFWAYLATAVLSLVIVDAIFVPA